ncbi:MAG: RNA polymerase sigma-70 factor [Chitinophagaceae bacterium]|nr:RNA polymerase sigma-70 factor [Chitinophagaceae bacterium]
MNELAHIRELQRRIALYEDMRAYEDMYKLLSPGLRRFSSALVKSKESSEEIVSDVFIKLWEVRGRLEEIENLKVYLYTITKNFSLNYISKNFKNPVISLDEIDVGAVVFLNGPDEMCISADMVRQLKAIIQSLPPQCRLVFQLVKEEDMRYKEVAAVLNLSVFTVRNQLAIAIRKIGEAMPSYLLPQGIINDKFSRS